MAMWLSDTRTRGGGGDDARTREPPLSCAVRYSTEEFTPSKTACSACPKSPLSSRPSTPTFAPGHQRSAASSPTPLLFPRCTGPPAVRRLLLDWLLEQMDPSERDGGSRKSNKPKYSKFSQQELPACKPLLIPKLVVTVFLLMAVLFIPIGLAALFASLQAVELVERYDISCVPIDDKVAFIQSSKIDKTCNITLQVPKYMKSPILVYYQIGNFYQNHRRYVRSRNDKQLRYKNVHLGKECEPEGHAAGGVPIVPCGLVAWSLFNDTFTVKVNGETIEVNKKDIAWKSDKKHKLGNDIYPSNFQKGRLIGGAKLNESIPLSEQEDLIVWMRTAAFPTFRKLYGRIEKEIMAEDNITVVIQNNYNTYSFGGSKAVVLSTASWIGGRNNFIGIAYLTIGGLCLFLALGFTVLYMVKARYVS
ncbi:ALA-interacting subunit 1-like [Lolium rigidum]|uniref:ALA-interacting subunit 1-like n=1 Tax=Lolium rigidum TaxID=89674 RepID=UPI001F5DA804|nr:ALA-interacting subunit 1-like [Lolium rigidum]